MVNSTYGLLCKLKEVGVFDDCVKNGIINSTLAWKKKVYETYLSIKKEKRHQRYYEASVLLDIEPRYVRDVVKLFES